MLSLVRPRGSASVSPMAGCGDDHEDHASSGEASTSVHPSALRISDKEGAHKWDEGPLSHREDTAPHSPHTSDFRSDADPRSPLVGLDRINEVSLAGGLNLVVHPATQDAISTPDPSLSTMVIPAAVIPSTYDSPRFSSVTPPTSLALGNGGKSSPAFTSVASGKNSPAFHAFVPPPLPKPSLQTRGGVYVAAAPANFDSPEDENQRSRSLAYSTPNNIRSLTRPGNHELSRQGKNNMDAPMRGRGDRDHQQASGEMSYDFLLDGAPLPTDFLSSGADSLAARSVMHSLQGAEARDKERTSSQSTLKYLQAQQAQERAALLAAHQTKSALLSKLLQVDGAVQVLIKTLTQGGQFLLHSSPLSITSLPRTLGLPSGANSRTSSRNVTPSSSPAKGSMQAKASARATVGVIAANTIPANDPSPAAPPASGPVTSTAASSANQVLAAQPRTVWVSPDLRYIFCSTDSTSSSSGGSTAGVLQVDQILVIFPGHQTRVFRERMAAARRVSVTAGATIVMDAMGPGIVATAAAITSGRKASLTDPSTSTPPPVCLASHCFSLITPSRTLDLECASESERDNWLVAFQFLLDHSRSLNSSSHAHGGPAHGGGGVGASFAQEMMHLPGAVPFSLPIGSTLSQALELISTMPPSSQSTSSRNTPDLAPREASSEALRSVTVSPDQGQRLPRASSSGTSSSAASSVGGTPAFGSPIVSPLTTSRSLLQLSHHNLLMSASGHSSSGSESGLSSVTSTHSSSDGPPKIRAPEPIKSTIDVPPIPTRSVESHSQQRHLLEVVRPAEALRRRSYGNVPVLEALPDKVIEEDQSALAPSSKTMEKESSSRDQTKTPVISPAEEVPSSAQQMKTPVMSSAKILSQDILKTPVLPTGDSPLVHATSHAHPHAPQADAKNVSPENKIMHNTQPNLSEENAHPIAKRASIAASDRAAAVMPASVEKVEPVPAMVANGIPPPVVEALKPIPLAHITLEKLKSESKPLAIIDPQQLVLPPPALVLPQPAPAKKPSTSPVRATTAADLQRLRALIKRERSDNAHLRVWVAHRFLHLQSHINSLMIEQRKLLAQKAQQEKDASEEVEREIKRIMGATSRRTSDAEFHRRCKSVY